MITCTLRHYLAFMIIYIYYFTTNHYSKHIYIYNYLDDVYGNRVCPFDHVRPVCACAKIM